MSCFRTGINQSRPFIDLNLSAHEHPIWDEMTLALFFLKSVDEKLLISWKDLGF